MTRIAKLYAHVLANPRAELSFRDFEALILAAGFELQRQRGSHRAYRHAQSQRPLIVQPRGAKAKTYQVEQFLDMLEEYRISVSG